MEQNNASTVVSPPASNNTDPTTAPTVSSPTDTTRSHTAPETVPTEPPATRSLPTDDPMAILPAVGAPPPQYDEHKNHALAPLEPAQKTTPASPQAQGLISPQLQVIPIAQLGEVPRRVQCPFCNQEALTRTTKESTSSTSMAAICCCIFGGIICAFLPYCMEMCHDTHHFCTNCGAQVATFPHEGPVQQFSPQAPGPVIVAPGPIRPPEAVMKN
ncbi:uncharacterized protein N7515_008661 [Penicillium bovifimosum]|uniref:LITAF domain-containing protein n=1 Tax=Penicillium bovifimosum TaxID=126998 RepID=A0A9W9GNC5_9EURO|nr:uncharacterized protein N7515_008661 [Penicillium bovifimosum]KAJ5124836.1 hypothetical protein N7515_008661 [Penicillium bovifimosum]